MHWTEFILSFIELTIWPTVLVIALIVLRKPIEILLPNTKHLKFKDMEMDFGSELHAVAESAEETIPDMRIDRKSGLIAMVKQMPNNAILESWKVLEETAVELIRTRKPEVNLAVAHRYKLIEKVLGEEFIDTKMEKIFSELRVLRNKVAHAKGFDVDKVEAVEYIELCFKLNDYLRTLMQATNKA